MSMDPLSPIAPARVRALVVPVGQIKRERFDVFVDRLNAEQVVHLRDISADGRPNRNMFSPLAFPSGAIFFELLTHVPSPSHLALSPFDLYREPLALLAIADGTELGNSAFSKRRSGGKTVAETNIRSLVQDLEALRDVHPKIFVQQVLLFDYMAPKEDAVPIPEDIVTIPPREYHKRTTMKTIMCDISSLILAEMTTIAKSFEVVSYIESPGNGSALRQTNGASQTPEGLGALSRRNSQFSLPTGSRFSSASGMGDRSLSRNSMPPGTFVASQYGTSSSTPARPSTPVNGRSALSNPPTTFEAVSGGAGSDPGSPEQGTPSSRPGTAEGFRTQNQDRVSVQGFGPGGLNERWRNKGKSRVQIIMGSLYLQAGRWSDAVRELIEGATVAKSTNDHLWHGKALELILVCLLLLGWADIEFQVPTVLLPPEKAAAAAVSNLDSEIKDPTQPRWMRYLQNIIPDLTERILALYSRISAEHLPPLPLAEATIRFCKLMTAIHLNDGLLGRPSLEMMMFGRYSERPVTTATRFTINPPRTHIANILFKAFPAPGSEVLTTVDRIAILSGVASVLGFLGFQRKKALVARELVSVLIAGLVEARTRGAADVGIHPAAGLAAANGTNGSSHGAVALDLAEGDIDQGLDAFLGLLLKTYGVVTNDIMTNSSDVALSTLVDNSDSMTVSRIRRQSAARFFGMRDIKLNILRACVSFSEALPDFEGVMRFSSDLLRTAGSGMAPGPRREDVYPAIARDEQVRLVTTISKTSNLSKRMGLGDLKTEYWDEFLVRGVKLESGSTAQAPIPHSRSILPNATTARASQDVNPFIYNPFLKQPDTTSAEKILVAGEVATFKITLQNPYEVEVVVDRVRLDTEGVEFDSAVESTILGPYRTQVLKVSGTPRGAGPLRITGAIIQVRGCRERRFPIFHEPWAPEDEEKIKAVGLGALDRHISSPSPLAHPLKPEHLELNVISRQPVVAVKSTTLPQSSVMILEGERQSFSVTLENLSTSTPVDFLLFSFQDSTQEPLQAALGRRDASAAELYEYELILTRKQALRMKKRDNKRFIGPGDTTTFEFEILGKPGLTNGLIQIDYAYLGVSSSEIGEKFFTRQVSLELTVTVNASIEIARMDILPIQSVPQPLWSQTGHTGKNARGLTADQYCLLVLDLRNAWPSHMAVELEMEGGAKVEEYILPGNTSRVILPLRRIYLEDAHAFIPALNPSRQRQFVVSTKISPDVERANREAFWYREKILEKLHGTWRATMGGGRHGTIELRSMRLTSRMIEAIKVDEVDIEILVGQPATGGTTKKGAKYGNESHRVFIDEPEHLCVRITNRTKAPIHPTVRLMPALRHRPLNVALDFTRKLAWNGTLQQSLAPVAGEGGVGEMLLSITPLCRGEFEFTASVEETCLWSAEKENEGDEEKGGRKGRPRSNTQLMMDAALGVRERKIWHTRRACYVVVKDREVEQKYE